MSASPLKKSRAAGHALTTILLMTAAAGLFMACGSQPLLEPIQSSAPESFDQILVTKGAVLAALGNCASCHTAADGSPYAGGRPLQTPFGTVFGTNITPELDTGIGRWSEEAFARALREGLDREGRHLYPVFPYDHYTRLTDQDVRALYAFFMTREPVRAQSPPNRIPIPRAFISVWKAMYLKKGPFRANPQRSAQWNRGAYLVESLAHCSACHTPRNFLGAEKKREFLDGGQAEGWHGPALTAQSPSPVPWTPESLHRYLTKGTAEGHAQTAGPMVDVVQALAQVPEGEIRAVVEYISSFDERPLDSRKQRGDQLMAEVRKKGIHALPDQPALRNGAAIYVGACAACHDRGRESEGGALQLRLAIGLTIPTSYNLIKIIDEGIIPAAGEPGPWMPSYKGELTDQQLMDLVNYLRWTTGLSAWQDVENEVQERSREQKAGEQK